jgi:dihydropteroate synthase
VAVRGVVMGIVNTTADSFSDGGRFLDPEAAIAHGLRLVAEGAGIVDVGGESTRPGSSPVPADEQVRRVVPVVAGLAPHVRVSVDTRDAAVAEAAVAAGATIINDVGARLWEVAAATGAGWVAMHVQGEPATMQVAPRYDDVVAEVSAFLADRAARARAAGVAEVWVDPGIGFGKTAAHNLEVLARLDELVAAGTPVAVGTSRKGFLGALTGGAGVEDRLEASVATAVWALAAGAALVRVHDVAATVAALRIVSEEVPA